MSGVLAELYRPVGTHDVHMCLLDLPELLEANPDRSISVSILLDSHDTGCSLAFGKKYLT